MILDKIKESVIEGKWKDMASLVEEVFKSDFEAQSILEQALYPAMSMVGDKFSSGEFFIPDMLLSAKAMQSAISVLKPHLKGQKLEIGARVVLGTVEGDLHDIGKNLVKVMLEGSGYQVIDLGVDTKAEEFVDALNKYQAEVLGLSGLLTTTLANVPKVLESLKEANLRDKVLVAVGGAPVTEDFIDRVGADLYGKDANMAVKVITRALAERRAAGEEDFSGNGRWF